MVTVVTVVGDVELADDVELIDEVDLLVVTEVLFWPSGVGVCIISISLLALGAASPELAFCVSGSAIARHSDTPRQATTTAVTQNRRRDFLRCSAPAKSIGSNCLSLTNGTRSLLPSAIAGRVTNQF